jgi:hypothetical protein
MQVCVVASRCVFVLQEHYRLQQVNDSYYSGAACCHSCFQCDQQQDAALAVWREIACLQCG